MRGSVFWWQFWAVRGASGANTGGNTACVPDYNCHLVAPNTGDPYEDCVARVNQFRACVCFLPLTRAGSSAEACVSQHAEYDSSHGAHAGFMAGLCSPSPFAENECPAWPTQQSTIDGCVQSMFEEGPPPSEPCEDDCYQAHGHFINLTSSSYTQVACVSFQLADGWWTAIDFY